jgi:hypothetical protein
MPTIVKTITMIIIIIIIIMKKKSSQIFLFLYDINMYYLTYANVK